MKCFAGNNQAQHSANGRSSEETRLKLFGETREYEWNLRVASEDFRAVDAEYFEVSCKKSKVGTVMRTK